MKNKRLLHGNTVRHIAQEKGLRPEIGMRVAGFVKSNLRELAEESQKEVLGLIFTALQKGVKNDALRPSLKLVDLDFKVQGIDLNGSIESRVIAANFYRTLKKAFIQKAKMDSDPYQKVLRRDELKAAKRNWRKSQGLQVAA